MSIKKKRKYIIHTDTNNISFIKTHVILKKLGIQNNKFFLRLYDAKLVGVDPYSKNLTKEQEVRIFNECVRNPFYFLREVIRIPVPGGLKSYELHRGNLALTFCMLRNLNVIQLLPRQHGKTIGALAVYVWFYLFATKNSDMILLNKEFSDSKMNLDRLKNMIKPLPDYLKFKNKNDVDNKEHISNATNGNTIKALGPANSEADADKKGRGATTPLQYWDEFAFIKHNDVMLGASTPATSQAMIEAEKNGKPHGKLITTTPNNIDLPNGNFCKKMINEATKFDEIFYDWTKDQIMEYINRNELNDFVYIEFNYRQLGRDEQWFKDQCRALQNDKLLIKREILLEWTKSSDNSVYDEEILDIIYNHIQDPVGYITLLGIYRISFYESVDFNKPYIISVDPSAGKQQDSTAINIIDPITHVCVADFRNNTINSRDLNKLLIQLIKEYFHRSLLVIENNSMGSTILDFLMYSPIHKNLYYEYVKRQAEEIEYAKKDRIVKRTTKKKKTFGISTTKVSRDLMMEILDLDIYENPHLFGRVNLYNDIKSLEYDRKGKIQHREGEHDDSLMSYLIGRYTLAYGTQISKFMRRLNIELKIDKRYDNKKLEKIEDLDIFKSQLTTSDKRMLHLLQEANNPTTIPSHIIEDSINQKTEGYFDPLKADETNAYARIMNTLNGN